MKVLVLGGDGFCGWPTTLHLSDKGHDVIVVDNLDLAQEYERFLELLRDERPDAIVHFGEQRAAPYSMRSATTKRYTVDNNVRGTHNVLVAIVESGLDTALVH